MLSLLLAAPTNGAAQNFETQVFISEIWEHKVEVTIQWFKSAPVDDSTMQLADEFAAAGCGFYKRDPSTSLNIRSERQADFGITHVLTYACALR